MKWDADKYKFAEQINDVRAACEKLAMKYEGKAITSTDKIAVKLKNALKVKEAPKGFEGWLLPFLFKDMLLSLFVGKPKALVPRHSHETYALHLVVAGSILLGKKKLQAGDWMFTPKGVNYTYRAGTKGAIIAYFHDFNAPNPVKR